jgi:hypothetical protein
MSLNLYVIIAATAVILACLALAGYVVARVTARNGRWVARALFALAALLTAIPSLLYALTGLLPR